MLKRRIIPKLLFRNVDMSGKSRRAIVTTHHFQGYRMVGDPVSQGKVFEGQASDELIFLDLDAQTEKRIPPPELIQKIAEEIFMPFAVGGGIRSVDDVREVLRNGADKVCINSAAIEDPSLITRATSVFGSQCVVVSIDYKRRSDGCLAVFLHGGMKDTGLDPVEWAVKCQELGAGEILMTSIDQDGTRLGLDLPTLLRANELLSIPLIASGGVGTTQHFVDGFLKAGVSAVSAGTFFAFKDESPIQARAHIKVAGIPMRS